MQSFTVSNVDNQVLHLMMSCAMSGNRTRDLRKSKETLPWEPYDILVTLSGKNEKACKRMRQTESPHDSSSKCSSLLLNC